jgi:hypothetical protein
MLNGVQWRGVDSVNFVEKLILSVQSPGVLFYEVL